MNPTAIDREINEMEEALREIEGYLAEAEKIGAARGLKREPTTGGGYSYGPHHLVLLNCHSLAESRLDDCKNYQQDILDFQELITLAGDDLALAAGHRKGIAAMVNNLRKHHKDIIGAEESQLSKARTAFKAFGKQAAETQAMNLLNERRAARRAS